jgi:hypothetical protein
MRKREQQVILQTLASWYAIKLLSHVLGYYGSEHPTFVLVLRRARRGDNDAELHINSWNSQRQFLAHVTAILEPTKNSPSKKRPQCFSYFQTEIVLWTSSTVKNLLRQLSLKSLHRWRTKHHKGINHTQFLIIFVQTSLGYFGLLLPSYNTQSPMVLPLLTISNRILHLWVSRDSQNEHRLNRNNRLIFVPGKCCVFSDHHVDEVRLRRVKVRRHDVPTRNGKLLDQPTSHVIENCSGHKQSSTHACYMWH